MCEGSQSLLLVSFLYSSLGNTICRVYSRQVDSPLQGISHWEQAVTPVSLRVIVYLNEGMIHYPNATSRLILCDGGGSNSSRHYIFKEDLQKTANELGLEIRIAHYSPYTSKYNPIEHRFFPHVTRACEGIVFDSVETVKKLISRTKTSTGLTTVVHILDKTYQTKRKYAADFKEKMPLVFDEYLPKWNYRAIPQI